MLSYLNESSAKGKVSINAPHKDSPMDNFNDMRVLYTKMKRKQHMRN